MVDPTEEQIVIPVIPDWPSDKDLLPYQTPLHQEKDETVVITRIQNDREYLKNVDWSHHVITLPDVDGFDEDRFVFNVDKYSIRMIPRKNCLDKLVQLINEHKQR